MLVGKPADGRVGLKQGLDELHTALGDLEQVLASTGPDQVGSVRLDEQGNLVIPPLSAEDVPAEATAVKEESAEPGRGRFPSGTDLSGLR